MVKSTPTRRSTLVQERSRASRAALVDAAEALWADTDLDEVKVGDICDQAGVSKGLFYFYFQTKEDLAVEMLLADADAAAGAADAALATDIDAEAALDAAVAAFLRKAQKRPRQVLTAAALGWLGSSERHDPLADGHTPLSETFSLVAAHGQERDELDTAVAAVEVGRALEWAVLGALLEWASAASRQPSLAKRVASRTSLVIHGATT